MDPFGRLQSWYKKQCDGCWEHQHGVEIGTLDNPGWSLSIDLAETELENKVFEAVRIGEIAQDYIEDPNWIDCKVKNNKFDGACGPQKLGELISIFIEWSESGS